VEESELIDRINALEETPVLLECSRRAKRRLGLRGGLLRNLLLSEEARRSVFDYTDPFSDLDCVVERREDWPMLSSSLASSLAYAAFYRWEVQTLQHITASLGNYPSLPSERLIVWFDGRSEGKGVSIASLGDNLSSELSADQLPTAFPAEERERPFWDRVLVALRRMRSLYQYAGDPEVRFLLENFNTTVVPEYPPTPLTTTRLQILLASIAMTSIHLPLAIKALRLLDELTRHALEQQGGQIWRRLLASAIDESSRVTTSIYGGRRGRRRIDLQVQQENSANGSINTFRPLIPWTLMQSPHDPSCCEYSDFRFGVAVVASRGASPASLSQIEAAEIVALAVDGPIDDLYRPDRDSLGLMEPLPLPGIVTQSAQSIVLRVDHGFPAAYLDRSTTFFASALSPENAQ
jgi:hypothetical protein